jgi:molecular chaperone DnaK
MEPERVLVLDLGGGIFDATVLQCRGSRIVALATDGDDRLGGCDWDDRLTNFAAEQFIAQHHADPREDPNAAGRLRLACEAAKCSLSSASRATITYQYRGRSTQIRITREDLERVSGDLLERMRVIILRTVKAAGLGWSGIDQVLLAGGSSRMPMVRRMVHEISGKDLDTSALEHETVAQGAALLAADQLAKKEGQRPRFHIAEVNSHSLGVVGVDARSGRRRNAILIPRNTPLPASVKRTFKTKESDHDSLQLRIIQGDSDSPEECTRIGKCEIGASTPGFPPGSPVTVEFHCGADGRLTVSVETAAKTHRAVREIQRAAGLSREHLDRWRQWVETIVLCSNV